MTIELYNSVGVHRKWIILAELRDMSEEPDNKRTGVGLNVVMLLLRNIIDDITDEVSADEDCPNINNLPSSQLMAPLVI